MNLSNEKNTLLNTVSRLAVSFGARASVKFVTRGAMAAAALTVVTYALVDTSPAIASCNIALATGDGGPGGVICSSNAAGGFDSDGYDNIDLDIRPDSRAEAATGLIFDPSGGAGEKNNSDGNTVLIFDTDPLGFGGTDPGLVNGTAGDGILIVGDSNKIRNGAGNVLGGGTIIGTDDGIDITGTGNLVSNANNGYGSGSVASGLISGGGSGAGDDGIVVTGGTAGAGQNVIDNGAAGKATAYIISGGTTGAVTGDDGIDVSEGFATITNGQAKGSTGAGVIEGGDSGIEFTGDDGDTLTVDNNATGTIKGGTSGIAIIDDDAIAAIDNDGSIVGTTGDGIEIGDDGSDDGIKVTITSANATGKITGGDDGIGIDSDNAVVAITDNTVEGLTDNGIRIGGNESSDNTSLTITNTTVLGATDGIHVDDGSDNVTINVNGTSSIGTSGDRVGDDGIEGNETLNVNLNKGSIYATDNGIELDDADADGGVINVGDGSGTADALVDTLNGAGVYVGDNADNNDINVKSDGVVHSLNGPGIKIGNGNGSDVDNNDVVVDGKVSSTNGSGIVINGQDDDSDGNDIDVNATGVVSGGVNGVVLAGNGDGSDGDDNDLKIDGGFVYGNADNSGSGSGVEISNENSIVDNNGGTIVARGATSNGITMVTDHLGPGLAEAAYQDDAASRIIAGGDGIHYNADNNDGGAELITLNGGIVAGGDGIDLANFDDANATVTIDGFIIAGTNYSVKVNGADESGSGQAASAGVRGGNEVTVNNNSNSIAVFNGDGILLGDDAIINNVGTIIAQDDGTDTQENATITNSGTIATAAKVYGGPGGDTDDSGATDASHGIELNGESNTVSNSGTIDTRNENPLDLFDPLDADKDGLTHEADGTIDTGVGADGIHANVNGLTLGGLLAGNDQQVITNSGKIYAADDGIDVKSGFALPGAEQIIKNTGDGEIHAWDDGIVAENYNIITNAADALISADEDNKDGGDGINVGHSNVVTNFGTIEAGDTGNGIVMTGEQGPFSFGNLVTNTGDIDAGLDGIQVNGEQNFVKNSGNIKGGVNGVAINEEENDFVSTAGDIEGGTGAGIYADEDNDIELSGTTKVFTTNGLGGDGIVLDDDNSLEIDDGVNVWGDNDGIVLEGDDNDVDYEGGALADPELKGRTGDALRIEGDSNTFDSTDDLDLQGGDDGIQISGNTNSVDIDGDVGGEDDGIYLDTATGNVITVGGNVTGDTDNLGTGDGIDISGGGSNNVTVTGAISGDPGVIIENSSNNVVSGASIAGTKGGVVISNGDNNSVSTTSGDITGGDNAGVDIDGDSNVVSSADDIEGGTYGVIIDGSGNEVSADGHIEGTDEAGISIDGNSNTVDVGEGVEGDGDGGIVISGNTNTVDVGEEVIATGGDGVGITGNSNSVDVTEEIEAEQVGVEIDGNSNTVSSESITGDDGDGVNIAGSSNTITTGDITSNSGDGIEIESGSGNTITAANVTGTGGSGAILGSGNTLNAGGAIEGGNGDGVSLSGNSKVSGATTISGSDSGAVLSGNGNTVTASSTIIGFGDEGVAIDGNSNNVSSEGITGNWDGVDISGNSNIVDSGSLGISGSGGQGVDVTGNNNQITAGNNIVGGSDGVALDGNNNSVDTDGLIDGNGDEGVDIDGNSNSVTADGIEGNWDGAEIDGNTNTLTIGASGISGQGGDGVDISGTGNVITSGGTVSGNDDGVVINGGTNSVKVTGDITGTNGDGVDITGTSNVVSATGAITGDPGVIINGSSNNVSSASISATNDAVNITGSTNTVTTGAISSTSGDGIEIVSGSGNVITATTVTGGGAGALLGSGNTLNVSGAISGADFDGVQLTGGSKVTGATTITGADDGAELSGDGNSVKASGLIDGNGDEGVDIDGNNNTVTAGGIEGLWDGADIDGNTNTLTIGASGIVGLGGDGVDIFGLGNNVLSSGQIKGDDEGVVIEGINNSVVALAGGITGTDGNGVDVSGNNNSVAAANGGHISGGSSGAVLDGNNNEVTATNITGLAGDGVGINGNSNTIEADGNVQGTDDGVEIDGDSNDVGIDGFVTGTNGDGVDIAGAGNTVKVGGAITGDPGVIIVGNGNNVSGASITGTVDDGLKITGSSNTIGTLGAITGATDGIEIFFGSNNSIVAGSVSGGTNGALLGVDNDLNIVTNGASITGSNGVGVQVKGSSTVTAAFNNVNIKGSTTGADVDGNNNVISAGGTIVGTNAIGVDIDGNSNSVNTSGVTGGTAGATIDGTSNNLTVGAGGIEGKGGEGLAITGGSNTVISGGTVKGNDDAIEIDGGANNVTVTGDLKSTNADGVDIAGDGNQVKASGEITSQLNGVVIVGGNNAVSVGTTLGSSITAQTLDGVSITGSGNSVTTSAPIFGGDDGVEIDGDNNTVKSGGNIAGDVAGGNNGVGDGVDINGNGNTVTSGLSIFGDPGVIITGNQNAVSAVADINGVLGGAIISGNQNVVTAGGDITTTNGFGAGITGNQNIVSAGDDIKSTNDDGVNIAGNQNQVTANDIYGGIDGIQINGNQNFVDAANSVTGVTGNGVHFDSGTGNNVDLTNVTVTAGLDGILLDVDGNEFQHNSATVINAGDDGIEYEYGGLVNAYESLVWLGTINASDDGIVADSGFFTIINNGTINADKDKNSDGNGITVTSDNNVENNGTITGWNGIVGDDRNDILNDGIITVTNDGIRVDDDNKVINNGTITAGDDGIVAGDKNYIENNSPTTIIAADNGIEAGSLNTIVNTGTITADSDDNNDGDGINAVDSNTITNTSTANIKGWNGIVVLDTNTVTNNGNIVAENNGIDGDDSNTVVNTDDIDAGNIGVDVDTSNKVTNSGDIDAGNIGINASDSNTIINSGTIDATNAGGIGINAGSLNTITNSNWILGKQDGIVAVNSNTISNSGSVTGTTDDGVQLGSSNSLTNSSTGNISGGDDGVEISGSGNSVLNNNNITGTNDGVSVLSGGSNGITNNDLISGGDDGVDFDTAGNVLTNNGQVKGNNNGVEMSGGNNFVTNTGSIQGFGADGVEANGNFNDVVSSGSITGNDDGVSLNGNNNDVVNNNGSITGQSGDGVDVIGSSNWIYSTGSIYGEDEGIQVNGSSNSIQNGTSGDDNASIWGQEGDGIDIDSGSNNTVTNYGSITGFWEGIDNDNGDLWVDNIGGDITGQNRDGIRSNIGSSFAYTNIENSSENIGGEDFDQGRIVGKDDGIEVGGEGLYVGNYSGSLIQGLNDDGIHTKAGRSVIWNQGTIIGKQSGITDGSEFVGEDGQSTYIVNDTTGLITGGEAGYLYEDGPYNGEGDTVQIDNFGVISATDFGTLPTALVDDPTTKDVDESKGALDYVSGKGADPVAAIDTREGEDGLEVYIFNWGTINGANTFSAEVPAVADDPATKDVDETKAAIPPQQLTNRFAILGGEGAEYVANFDGGTINGDIYTQAGDDVLALEIGSTLNGNVNLGQTLETSLVLGLIKDDPTTKDVDESAGGTAVGFVSTPNVDTGLDSVILFGEGYQDLASNITEAEVMYVNDQITQGDVYSVGPEDGILMAAAVGNPVLENQPFPVGTWSLNGNVKVDGSNVWTFVDVDGDGNGVVDEETSSKDETIAMITGTVGTVVDNGRLNVGGTVVTEIPGEPTDEETGELEPSTYEVTTNSTAVLTSPVVDVWSGGILGGHGTIVTNPGANGGNGGVNLTGAVQGDKTVYVGADEEHIDSQFLPSEARGAFIIGALPVDNVTQDAKTGEITDKTKGDGTNDYTVSVVDGEDVKTDILVTQDSLGNQYADIKLPAGWVAEEFSGPFDFTTDSPRYATLAPGDEITRIGTLTVVGNVTMDGRETGVTNYKVAVLDDPATKDVDESKDDKGNQIYKNQAGREVVTNWGSQFQADLKDDGKGDLLLVKKSGVTTAFTGSTFDTTGLGTVDLVTQDADGKVTDSKKGDGVNDFTIVVDGETKTKVDTLVPGKGGPDGVPDGVSYKVSTVLDGHATVDGRLDIRLDGEFVDLVDNSQPATIPDPEGPTGCGDDPDGADSCPQVPNPLYAIPDGIADVDAKGVAKNNADFSKDAKVWDIIVAEGGVTGKFDEKGFDGGPNDGAVVVRYDDPETAEDEELRVQLLKAYLQYLPDRVRIISIPAFGPKGETINQIATGEYIDSLTKYGLNEDALHAVIALVGTATDIPAALDALHPEWYNAFNEVGFSIARGAEQQAYIRTIEAQGFSGGQQNRVVMNVGDDSAVGSSASDRRATFWLAGSWGNSSIDDGSNEGWLEYKYETLTGYAGFDYLINPNFLLGIMGGFSNSDVDARNGSGNEGDVDSWQVSGYVSYFTSNWFVNAGGGIGDMNIESIRNIQFGSGIGNISQIATADYDGDITFFYGKGGYSFDLGASGWKLSPELALSYAKVKQDGFSEGGTGNAAVVLLDVDGQSVESLRGTAQLRLSKTFMSGNGGGWMPYVRVGVANEFEDELRPITSGFQGAPGTSFTVFGKVPRETTVIFGAGVTGKVNEMFSLYLDYSGEIGGSFSEHVISGGVRLSF